MSFFRNMAWQVLFALTLVSSGLSSFALQIISTGLPLYCTDLGKTTAIAGLLAGFYSAAVIISRPFVGKWSDEKGKWNIAAIGFLLFILSIVFSCYKKFFHYFPVFQTIEGFGFSAMSTALAALAVDVLPSSSVVRGIGIFTVVKSLTISLGASFAATFADMFGTDNLFICSLIIAIIAFVLFMPLRQVKNTQKVYSHENNIAVDYKGIDKYIERSVVPICILQFVFTFSLTLGTSYLPSYAQTIGLSGIGIYYIVSAFTMFLSRTLLSSVFEKLNNKLSFVIGMFLAMITTLAVVFADKIPVFVVISFVNAIAISLINPTLNVMSTAGVDSSRRGVASSTYYGSLDLGSGAGAMIWGLIIPLLQYKISFIIATILLGITMLFGLRVFKKEH